jgi:DNA-binding SARP family transcriptional activator
MFDKDTRRASVIRLDGTLPEGWALYRQGVAAISQNDWSCAIELLAAAETSFSALDDFHGLWRALIGQALLHWRDGAPALALARAMAALRTAEAADDGFAVGCVAWQIANMLLGQGEYRRAADLLDQAQLGLDTVGIAPPDGALAVAAQLCAEIVRWQQWCDRQQVDQREAEQVINEIQQDLLARLQQAAAAVRIAPAVAATVNSDDATFLLPDPPALLALPDAAARPSLNGWLARLWRRLVRSEDASTLEDLTRVATMTLLPAESHAVEPREYIVSEPQPELPAEPVLAGLGERAALRGPAAPMTLVLERARPTAPGGLAIYCFGNCRVYWDDVLIDRWESARGRMIFKYLIAHRATAVSKEVLAELFWPESEPELARRSLHQAIYCLRQTFKRCASEHQIIKFAHDRYQIDPDLAIWVDSEEFSQAIGQARAQCLAGNAEHAMQAYAVAVDLYSAPFLAEDRYEGWTEELRRTYQVMYLEALHWLARYHFERNEYPMVTMLCQRALAEEGCDEDSHQLLMASYMAQGLRHLAVRQFQICTNTLKTELGLAPSEDLAAFYRRVVAAG